MNINGISIDPAKLMSKDELIDHLQYGGASDRALSEIRSRYDDDFGNELTWNYPISDGVHAGVTIVAVKEGFLGLPYDYIEKTEYELFELEQAYLLDEDTLTFFIDSMRTYSDDLITTMTDMLRIICGE